MFINTDLTLHLVLVAFHHGHGIVRLGSRPNTSYQGRQMVLLSGYLPVSIHRCLQGERFCFRTPLVGKCLLSDHTRQCCLSGLLPHWAPILARTVPPGPFP